VIGTGLLVGYVQSAKENAVAGEQLVDVLVVTKGVSRGAAATTIGGSVKTVQVPAKVRADGAVTDLASLRDLVASAELVPGEQVVAARFVTPQAVAGAEVPKGKLLTTVSLEPERAVGGQLQPGDTVAVLASFEPFGPNGEDGNVTPSSTNLILHKVLITAVQVEQSTTTVRAVGKADEPNDGPTAAPTGKLLITLALDAPAVERVVFAAEHGSIWLSKEPADTPQGGTRVVTRPNVY
jgi:pilus assembly protein CpaB